MKKIIALGASNSINSINKKFAYYAADLIENVEVNKLDLNNYELPLFSIDIENAAGIPEDAKVFSNEIENADGIVLSLAEHNSNFTAAFKSITDWVSRLDGKTWRNKKVLLLSTSPGGRGGASAMEIGLKNLPFAGAQIISHFSLPRFYDNFKNEDIVDVKLKQDFLEALGKFKKALTED